MILLIGGAFSGRRSFAQKLASSLVAPCDDANKKNSFIYETTESDAAEFAGENAIPELSRVVERITSFPIAIAVEMGCGVVPVSEYDRTLRENNGRLNIALAKVAETVVLMTAGIPTVIKGDKSDLENISFGFSSHAVIFRHGQTLSNVQRRFAGGGSDVLLTELGEQQAFDTKSRMELYFSKYQEGIKNKILNPKRVFVSPMTRAKKTAEILFPNAQKIIVDDIREMRMGLFENMTNEELLSGLFADGSKSEENAECYQKWLDSKGTLPTPTGKDFIGESQEDFVRRSTAAFRKILSSLEKDEVPVLVAHGGIQMSICETIFTKGGAFKNLHDWQSENAMFRFGELKI